MGSSAQDGHPQVFFHIYRIASYGVEGCFEAQDIDTRDVCGEALDDGEFANDFPIVL